MLFFLIITVFILVGVSAFFSGSETAMMSLNRYRLKHLARHNHRGARLARKLLERPERLLGIILIGNTTSNIVASAVATIVASSLFGEAGVAVVAVLLTFIILLFAEIMPKTLAALNPERYAFPACWVLSILLRVFYPLVWLLNLMAIKILSPFGIQIKNRNRDLLSKEELRTVVTDSTSKMTGQHRNMLLGVLDLETVTITDVMIPRHKISGLDLNEEWATLQQQLVTAQHHTLPVYRDHIDDIEGIIQIRKVVGLLANLSDDPKKQLIELVEQPYYIPESTTLQRQLIEFQQRDLQFGLVVDEYGELLGLATVDDILEEVVGEFTEQLPPHEASIRALQDGSFVVNGGLTIRELNRRLNLTLPVEGPKTLSGLITEHLEVIPTGKCSIRLQGFTIEVIDIQDNAVAVARIYIDEA